MSWVATFGVGFLTATIAAAAAGVVTYGYTVWYRVNDAQEAGSTAIFLIILALFLGFIIGLVAARSVSGGFWRALACSTAIVLIIAGISAAVGRLNGEVAPTLGGESLWLEVELKCPLGWKPDHRTLAGQNSLMLWPSKLSVYGHVDWEKASQAEGGRWMVPGSTELFNSRRSRFVRMTLGKKTDIVFGVPLPAAPRPKDEAWTAWSRAQDPNFKDYEFRLRVQRDSAMNDRNMAAQTAKEEALQNWVDSLPPSDPLERWLAPFDNVESGVIEGARARALAVIRTKMAEFPAVLRSPDRRLVARALEALYIIRNTPPELIPSLAMAGHHVVEYIRAARAASLPDDPDLVAQKTARHFFFLWDLVMGELGAPAHAARLPVLEEIAAETGNEHDEDLASIASDARRNIEQIRQAGNSQPAR